MANDNNFQIDSERSPNASTIVAYTPGRVIEAAALYMRLQQQERQEQQQQQQQPQQRQEQHQ